MSLSSSCLSLLSRRKLTQLPSSTDLEFLTSTSSLPLPPERLLTLSTLSAFEIGSRPPSDSKLPSSTAYQYLIPYKLPSLRLCTVHSRFTGRTPQSTALPHKPRFFLLALHNHRPYSFLLPLAPSTSTSPNYKRSSYTTSSYYPPAVRHTPFDFSPHYHIALLRWIVAEPFYCISTTLLSVLSLSLYSPPRLYPLFFCRFTIGISQDFVRLL